MGRHHVQGRGWHGGSCGFSPLTGLTEGFLAGDCAPGQTFLLTDLPLPPLPSSGSLASLCICTVAMARPGALPGSTWSPPQPRPILSLLVHLWPPQQPLTQPGPPNQRDGEGIALPFQSLLKTEPPGGKKTKPTLPSTSKVMGRCERVFRSRCSPTHRRSPARFPPPGAGTVSAPAQAAHRAWGDASSRRGRLRRC